MARKTQYAFQTVETEGALLPADFLKRITDGDKGVDGLTPDSYHLDPSEKINEVINRAWIACREAWLRFQKQCTDLPESDKGTTLTRERWLLVLFRELGYGRLQTTPAIEIDGKSYPISHGWGPAPIHLISFRHELDRPIAGVSRVSPHSLVQELLNRSDDRLWGLLSNGLQLRILRDNVSFTRAAYIEFDLETMMTGDIFPDFRLLWLLCHQSRLEIQGHREQAAAPGSADTEEAPAVPRAAPATPSSCWLEKWHQAAKQQGTRALDRLRDGVQKAIEALGQGFLAHRVNAALRQKLADGTLITNAYYQQIHRLVYRFIFLFVAEDRDLLLPSDAPPITRRRYETHYSLARIRRLAERRRGTRHSDLWQGARLVFRLLQKGEPRLGVPGLGSMLFSDKAMPDLDGCELANDALLAAVRHLAFTEDRKILRQVDYRNLGSEELGSVYESLLELNPTIDTAAATFSLAAVAGSERKTTGSYYTPSSLVQCLLDSALDPVIEDRLRGKAGKDAEQALLALKVCDPACGSGHFLIAAAHRIAKRLAAVRTGDAEPAPQAVRTALRDVIGHCIYGVDINPMAVELCKVALWMEALEPGKPLSFLDHRILCGNSLLGATPSLLAKGIPDAAFEPIEGDDKAVCRELKRRNKDERKTGQEGFIFDMAMPALKLGNLPAALMQLDAIDDGDLAGIKAKEDRWRDLVQSSDYASGRMLADAWCAAFVWKKTKEMGDAITESVFRRLEHKGQHDLPPWMRDEIQRLAAQYQFFHWQLAFPDAFPVPVEGDTPDNEQRGWRGGFDAALGNPPWEQVQLDPREFFAARAPDIASAPHMAARNRAIASLKQTDPIVHSEYLAAARALDGMRHFAHDSGLFPLTSYGRLNSAPLFCELGRSLLSSAGRLGMILPTGIATDSFNQHFFSDLVHTASLVSLFSFENEEFLFPQVHHAAKFCLLTLSNYHHRCDRAQFIFYARSPAALTDPKRLFTLHQDDFALLNPSTSTCPIFRSPLDAEITKHLYRRWPVLFSGNQDVAHTTWQYDSLLMFMMNTSSSLFRTAEALSADGYKRTDGDFRKGDDTFLPLYEAKMMHLFDHRFGTYDGQTKAQANQSKLPELTSAQHADPFITASPQYWMPQREVEMRLLSKWERPWLIGWRRISNTTNERTLITCILPRAAAGDSLFLMLPRHKYAGIGLYANFCTLVFDFIARQKMGGTNLNFYIVEQLPLVRPDQYRLALPWGPPITLISWMRLRVLELAYTAWDLRGFAADHEYDAPPFCWDESRRFLIQCELDAAFFHLYLPCTVSGDWHVAAIADDCPHEETPEQLSELKQYFPTPRHAVDYILETFPIVKRKDVAKYGSYRTKETILSIYDEMAGVIAANAAAEAAGRPPTARYQTRLNPPPGPPADKHGNFLLLPEWKPGQPRPTDWPSHIHPPREVDEQLRTAAKKRRTEQGLFAAYLGILLDEWKRPVTREALEPALILMLNDSIRQALVSRGKVAASRASARVGGGIVRGMDRFLGGLAANGFIRIEEHNGRQVISRGEKLEFIESHRAVAREAIAAWEILGEQRAMSYLESEIHEPVEFV